MRKGAFLFQPHVYHINIPSTISTLCLLPPAWPAIIRGKKTGMKGDVGLKEQKGGPLTIQSVERALAILETLAQAAKAQVYLTSVNALAETGQLVNIDGTGNRISAAAGAHETVCYLVGRNKIAPTFQQALWRARNIAAPLNARRLHRKTPCAQGETLRCYDCRSPERICNGLSVLWRPLGGVGETLVCLVGEDLGY